MTDYNRILKKPISTAQATINVELRTHAGLTKLLIDALFALLEIRKDEAGFIEFAHQNFDLKVTGKAVDPICLLLIKTIFMGSGGGGGGDGDAEKKGTDMRRWHGLLATALRFLEEKIPEIPDNHLPRYVHHLGGVSGCAKAWRKAHAPDPIERERKKLRRIQKFLNDIGTIGFVAPAANGNTVLVLNKEDDRKSREALIQQPGRIVLVGDVDENANLSNLRIIIRDQDEITRLLERKSRAVNDNEDGEGQADKEAA